MSSLVEKFVNQVMLSFGRVSRVLIEHPLVLEPESNFILHQFEGLCLHVNHFGEKNRCEQKFDIAFRDMANSIKHLRHSPEEQIELTSSILYEVRGGQFRFVKNSIQGTYSDGRKLDAVSCMCDAINLYCKNFDLEPVTWETANSVYGFFDTAVAYHFPEYSPKAKSVRLNFVERIGERYVPIDPHDVKFAVLDRSFVGFDPGRISHPINMALAKPAV